MAPPLIVRAILDAVGYLKVSESVVSSNTLMGESALGMGADFVKGAEAQVAAGAKVIASQRAQLAQLKILQGQAVAGSDRRVAADVAVARAQTALNRSMGITAISTRGVASEAKEAERDFGKLTRGALAGSGVFSKLGRSLAFASTGFIAVAGGATVIAESIRQAEGLAAAQRQVDRQLQTSGKSWSQYGGRIDSVLLKEGHLAGFTRKDLLGSFAFLLRVGGNVSRSLNLVGLAADVARGRNISLQAASIALSKALGGSATALRRLGIVVPNNVTKLQALEYVQKKFTGQAEAGTTMSDRLSASLADAGATIGTVVLPTFDRLATHLSNYVAKANESGRLTRDVGKVVGLAGDLFHALGAAIHVVDKITGSFADTLKIILALKIGFWAAGLTTKLFTLAAGWTAVATAAGAAEAAQAGAVTATAAGGGAVVLERTAASAVVGEGAAVGTAGAVAASLSSLVLPLTILAAGIADLALFSDTRSKRLASPSGGQVTTDSSGQTFISRGGRAVGVSQIRAAKILANDVRFERVNAPEFFKAIFGFGRSGVPSAFRIPGFGLGGRAGVVSPGPFGTARAQPQATGFQLTILEQLAQARAAMTQSTKDDVAVATQIVRRIKRILDQGNFTNKGLLALLQAEGDALSTIRQAQQAAAEKAAAAKAAALARASTYDVPGALQLAQAKAEAYGKSEVAILHKIIAAAQRAINSGTKNWQGLVAAYGVIAQARSALEAQAQQALIPLKLQLALAKAQATGADQTPILLKMRAALEKALKKSKGNIQKQIDIWNQIAQINDQLGQNVNNAYGDYRKASTQWLTQGLGLSADERAKLRARLSQIGPGGTHPMTGTGAAGFIIDPATGRPVHAGPRHHRGSTYTGPGGGRPQPIRVDAAFDIYIDGVQVEATVTKRQQRRRRHNPPQRRGPNTATAAA